MNIKAARLGVAESDPFTDIAQRIRAAQQHWQKAEVIREALLRAFEVESEWLLDRDIAILTALLQSYDTGRVIKAQYEANGI